MPRPVVMEYRCIGRRMHVRLTMDATNGMMPPKRVICNGKHFSISLAANGKSIQMNASEKIIVCCLVDSIPTIYTNGVNNFAKKVFPIFTNTMENRKDIFKPNCTHRIVHHKS